MTTFKIDIRHLLQCCISSIQRSMLDDDTLTLGRTVLCTECSNPIVFNGSEWMLMRGDSPQPQQIEATVTTNEESK